MPEVYLAHCQSKRRLREITDFYHGPRRVEECQKTPSLLLSLGRNDAVRNTWMRLATTVLLFQGRIYKFPKSMIEIRFITQKNAVTVARQPNTDSWKGRNLGL